MGASYIEKITIKKDYVKISVCEEDTETIYKISPEFFFENKFKQNSQLSDEMLQSLERNHIYFYAYEKCIRKLGAGDKSKKEIVELLSEIKSLADEDRVDIIDKLVNAGYINDESVAETQLYIDQNKNVGKKKTALNLAKRGVDTDIIDKVLSSVKANDEIQRGVVIARKTFEKSKGKSQKERIKCVHAALISNGFESVDEIIQETNLARDDEREMLSLRSTLLKAKTKYAKKYSGNELKFKIYQYLLTKGYEREMIQRVVEEIENEN